MRRAEFSMDRAQAREFLARAELIRLATSTPEGEPVLRTLNAVVLDDWLLFHGAKAGEKARCLGRTAVVSADELLATVPSYFTDPERACPATSLYESAMAQGTLESIQDGELKARMLTALMQKYQPEGGYAPIDHTSEMYRGAVRGVLVFGVRLDRIAGKLKVLQNKPPEVIRQVIEGLWQRGGVRDVHAIQRIFGGNPGLERPARFMIASHGLRLEPELTEQDWAATFALIRDQYWNRDYSQQELRRAHLESSAWVGVRSASGELVGTARAVSDNSKHTYLADVVIEERQRGRGIGRRLIEFLLEHPKVRASRVVRLGTADAQPFYRKLGFVPPSEVDFGFSSTPMLLVRPSSATIGRSPAL
ncbi:MAG TPA: pyridoxamine 5'-phosphate oxidase family protein [Polyangiaceae bacterium]|nr:pyridoxamine 5'-phosphate oxidase family protein [Polyangiaceae bacterium]